MNFIAHIESNEVERGKEPSKVHYLPCTIKYDGSAPIDTYFLQSENDNQLNASYRGRGMIGKLVQLPKNTSGIYLDKVDPSSNAYSLRGQFNNIYMWEHNKNPDLTQTKEILNWIEIARQVCELSIPFVKFTS